MKRLCTLFICLAFLQVLSAQTIDNCNDMTAIGVLDLFTAILTDQPYTAGVNETYCFETNVPLATGVLGTVSLSSDIVYPFSIVVTDLSDDSETTLTNFEDAFTLINNRFYFLEIVPTEEGEGDVAIDPTNSLLQLAGAEKDTITVRVERNLPVTWQQPLSFALDNKQIKFNWSVNDQVNVADYELQKSDGGEWFTVTIQPAREGRSAEVHYAATDIHGVEDANYRVKQNDFDGRFSYSNIILVPGASLPTELSIFPNPATDAINFSNPLAVRGLRLLNSAGRSIRELNDQGTNGTLSLAGLPPGIYLLEITDINGERTTRRVLRR